ncbi:MAG: hypothetical protein J5744_08350 [Oscillospiraceae bacterium]|nr:hypothetical protein [Oscillospiraceae bacterium]
MNKYPKAPALIIAVFFICLCLFGIFGIHTEYGDIRTAISYAVKESSTGTGLGKEILVTFLCPEGTELSDDVIDEICDVIGKRIIEYGINDARVYYDSNMNVFAVELAYTGRSSYDPNIIYDYVGKVGNVEIRAGNEKDDDGHPAGVTAETVIVGRDDIKDVNFSIDDSSSTTRYICDITFSGDSKKAIQEYTEKIINAETSIEKYYSIWLDDTMLTSRAFTSVIKDSVVPAGTILTSSSDVIDDYIGLRLAIASGKLPFELTPAYVYNFSEPDHSTVFIGALIMLLTTAIAFVAIAVIRYGLSGIASAVGMIGFVGAVSVMLSGGLSSALGLYVTKYVLYALAAAVVSLSLMMLSVLGRLSQAMRKSTVFRAAKDIFAAAEKRGALALVTLAAATVLLRIIYALVPGMYAPYSVIVSFTMFFAAGYVFLLLGSACIIKAMTSSRKLAKEIFYGGRAA